MGGEGEVKWQAGCRLVREVRDLVMLFFFFVWAERREAQAAKSWFRLEPAMFSTRSAGIRFV